MNKFIGAIDGSKSIDLYYEDTDSMYIENEHWDKFNEAGLVRKSLLQGRNDYGYDCGVFLVCF